MPRKRKDEGSFFVEDKACPTPGAALSYAQNLAVLQDAERSFYVRDALGKCYYRVDAKGGGYCETHTLLGWKP